VHCKPPVQHEVDLAQLAVRRQQRGQVGLRRAVRQVAQEQAPRLRDGLPGVAGLRDVRRRSGRRPRRCKTQRRSAEPERLRLQHAPIANVHRSAAQHLMMHTSSLLCCILVVTAVVHRRI